MDGVPLLQIAAHEGTVDDLDISADGKILISTGHDAKVFLWDVIEGHKLLQVNAPESLKSQFRVFHFILYSSKI